MRFEPWTSGVGSDSSKRYQRVFKIFFVELGRDRIMLTHESSTVLILFIQTTPSASLSQSSKDDNSGPLGPARNARLLK